ncbi:acyl-CoA thioesterase [Rhodococcus sp. NPDC057014]|uniref:acyl-CoA thioesterase n=1 Tax=Rhodococcus sp. NPDC057014 TaxID=3346000 RepID=UPI003636DFB4
MPAALIVPIRLHYYQFDQQGVVFNMWYMAFLEEARNACLASGGFSLQDLEASGHDIQVVHCQIDWTGAVRYGDQLGIEVRVTRIGRTSISMSYTALVNGCARATADAVYVIVDAAVNGKAEIPARLRRSLTDMLTEDAAPSIR